MDIGEQNIPNLDITKGLSVISFLDVVVYVWQDLKYSSLALNSLCS